jgi:hypothetical protein
MRFFVFQFLSYGCPKHVMESSKETLSSIVDISGYKILPPQRLTGVKKKKKKSITIALIAQCLV